MDALTTCDKSMHIEDFEAVDKMVKAAARSLWKKAYKMCWHVFSSMEDCEQVGWTAICARKSSRELVSKSIKGKKAFIRTIAYSGMQDYIRSAIGRKDSGSYKYLQITHTTRYMDYYVAGKNGGGLDYDISSDERLDLILPKDKLPDPESILIEKTLQKDIDDFFIRKLNTRDKMMLDHFFKKDMNLKEIAKEFGVTESRASQVNIKSIKYAQWRFNKVNDTDDRTVHKIMLLWLHDDPHLRFGQYFCNTYMSKAWPDLYSASEGVSHNMIERWLIKNQYEFTMPPLKKGK